MESENSVNKMKAKLFEFERTRECLKILREDAKRTREHYKELTKSNAQLQKDLQLSIERNQTLRVENNQLRDMEKPKMLLLPNKCDQIVSGSNSVEWKSAADSSSISPLEASGDFARTFELRMTNQQCRKGAIPRRQKSEGNQRELNHGKLEIVDDNDYKSQKDLLNLDDAEYLDCKGGHDIAAKKHGYELYNPEEYATSSEIDLKEQPSKRGFAYQERYDRENDWKLQGRPINTITIYK